MEESIKSNKNELKSMAEHFLCPILQERMEDPVIAADGHTYEREAIKAWINQRGARAISPTTGLRLDHHELQTNFLIKKMIEEYKSIKPRLKKKELDEKSIALAIQLRQEELDEFLKKKDRQLSLLSQEHEEVKEKLGPLHHKNQQLEKENKKLKSKPILNLNKPTSFKDKIFDEHLTKISTIQHENELLIEKNASNRIKRSIASHIIHKRLKQILLHNKSIEKLSNDVANSKQKIMRETNAIQREGNQQKELLKRTYDQQSRTIQNAIKKAAEMGQYDKLAGLSIQGTTVDKDYAIKVQLLKNEQDEKIKVYEDTHQKNNAQVISRLRQKKRAYDAKQNDINKRAARISFFTQSIEKEKQLLLDMAYKQKNQHTLFMLYAQNKSDGIIHKFNRKPEEPIFKTSHEGVTYEANKVAKRLNPPFITAFLKLVYEGDLEGAKVMLQKTPALAHVQGDITDLCGREFKNITGLQYATWCLDAEMAEMIYKTLSPRQAALQWDALENDRPDITKVHGQNFSFEGLLEAYNTFGKSRLRQDEYSFFPIGKEQQKVPAWYIYAFCEEGDNVAWWANQDLNLKIRREVAKNHCVKWMTPKEEGKGCGVSFVWARGDGTWLQKMAPMFLPFIPRVDDFPRELIHDTLRTKQLAAKQKELLSQLQVNCKKELATNAVARECDKPA